MPRKRGRAEVETTTAVKTEAPSEAPQANGKGATALQIRTLESGIRDAILREFKTLEKPWPKMGEWEQERAIGRARDIASILVHDAINIVASRGFENFHVVLGKITVDKGIECKFTLPFSPEAIAGLCARKGDTVILVARDAKDFRDGKKAETDNVGDLAIPKNGKADDEANLEKVQETMLANSGGQTQDAATATA